MCLLGFFITKDLLSNLMKAAIKATLLNKVRFVLWPANKLFLVQHEYFLFFREDPSTIHSINVWGSKPKGTGSLFVKSSMSGV